MGSNVLQMPPALMEKLCSPADASILQMNDALPFLRNVQAWSLGPDDSRRIEQTLERFGDRFLERVFTPAERARAERRQGRIRAASYAKRKGISYGAFRSVGVSPAVLRAAGISRGA